MHTYLHHIIITIIMDGVVFAVGHVVVDVFVVAAVVLLFKFLFLQHWVALFVVSLFFYLFISLFMFETIIVLSPFNLKNPEMIVYD